MFTQPARWGSRAPVLPHAGTDEGALALEDILHCSAAKYLETPSSLRTTDQLISLHTLQGPPRSWYLDRPPGPGTVR